MIDSTQQPAKELVEYLHAQAANTLGFALDEIQVHAFMPSKGIVDETTKLMVRDRNGEPRAVILCSSPASPDIIFRGVAAARLARAALGPELGRAVLSPIGEGAVQGQSFVIMPIAIPLSAKRIVRAIQRRRLQPAIFDWLWRAASQTLLQATGRGEQSYFRCALEQATSFHAMPREIRATAENALNRLETGAWAPKHVLMHGDLWLGNVMVDPNRRYRAWTEKFVLIDWPGSLVNGYPIFDLIRLSLSLRSSTTQFRSELDRHLYILSCGTEDAASYLVAALGHIALNIENYPVERYVAMSRNTTAFLEDAIR